MSPIESILYVAGILIGIYLLLSLLVAIATEFPSGLGKPFLLGIMMGVALQMFEKKGEDQPQGYTYYEDDDEDGAGDEG